MHNEHHEKLTGSRLSLGTDSTWINVACGIDVQSKVSCSFRTPYSLPLTAADDFHARKLTCASPSGTQSPGYPICSRKPAEFALACPKRSNSQRTAIPLQKSLILAIYRRSAEKCSNCGVKRVR